MSCLECDGIVVSGINPLDSSECYEICLPDAGDNKIGICDVLVLQSMGMQQGGCDLLGAFPVSSGSMNNEMLTGVCGAAVLTVGYRNIREFYFNLIYQ